MLGEQQTRVRKRRQRHTYLQEEQDDAFRVLLESRGAEIPENLQRKRTSADPADNTQNTGTSKRQRHNPRLQGSTTATSSQQTTIPVPSTRSPSHEPRVFSRSPSPPRPPSPTLDLGEPPVLEVPLPPRQFPVKMSTDFPDDTELLNQGLQSPLENLKIAAEFIKLLDNATLDSEHNGMDQDDVEMLRNPRQTPSIPEDGDSLGDLAELIECPHFWKCLWVYLATVGKGASEESYKATIKTLAEFYQDDPPSRSSRSVVGCRYLPGLSLSGTIYATTPASGSLARYHPNTRKPIKQFLTVPTTPWLQAFYRSVKTAELMHYRERETAELLKYAAENQGRIRTYNDTICGKNYLDGVQAGKIRKQDIVLQASQDGAQIYPEDKDSDCWFAIHIIHNLSPHLRYKKQFVMPTTIVPGPKKPKNIDSFMFPSAYHIAAVQAFVTEYYRTWTKHHLDKDPGLPRPKRQRTKSMARPNSPEPPIFPFNDPNLIKMDIDPEFTQIAAPHSPMDVDDGAKTSPLPSTSHRDDEQDPGQRLQMVLDEPPLPLTITPAPILNHLPLNRPSPSPSPPLSATGVPLDNGTALPSPGPPPGPPTPAGTSTAIESPEEHSAGLPSAAVPSNSPQVPSGIYDPFEVHESEGLTATSNPPDQQLERANPTVAVVAKVSPAVQAAGSSTRAGGRKATNRAQVYQDRETAAKVKKQKNGLKDQSQVT
ncbi:hypothetical protein PQX77_014118 [Marasmius sp. AFHP31]|nr:hypothetical protein PQX77_014118 [Marasmius sp. AFHP31]